MSDINIHTVTIPPSHDNDFVGDGPTGLQHPIGTDVDGADTRNAKEYSRLHCCDVHAPYLSGVAESGIRSLVVCIDGTTNKFGDKNSNVVKFYARLVKNDDQVTYYNSGIGTYPGSPSKSLTHYKRIVSHKLDAVVAWSFKSKIIRAYRWLSEHYQDGDRIFLFGFSRGAYQVRVLSAMIEKVGLIHKGNEEQLEFAFELYSKCEDSTPSSKEAKPRLQQYNSRAEVFKKTFARHVKVHFLGVWDTVSAVGLRTSKPLPLTNSGMKHVCFFRHALALDETRVKFLPVYAEDTHEEALFTQRSGRAPMLLKKEVWFAGDHSDIGGGQKDNASLTLNGPALRWMIKESSDAGLSFEPPDGAWATMSGQPPSLGKSRHWFYNLIEGVPMGWLTPTKSWWPHFNAKRELRNGQLIHESVFSMNQNYIANLPHGWNTREDANLEPDEFDEVSRKLSEHVDQSRVDETELRKMVRLESGHLAFLELLESLKTESSIPGFRAKMSILNIVANHFPPRPALDIVSEAPYLLGVLLDREARGVAKEFLRRFGNAQIDKISVGAAVKAVSFSPDRRYIAIGSSRPDVFLYDVLAGEVKSLHGHSHEVSCVQFYPGDLQNNPEKHTLVSGSLDGTIRIWEIGLEIRIQPQKEWEVYGGSGVGVLSVCFSTDGKKVTSTGLDCVVHIWDVYSDKKELHHRMTLAGHGRRVFSAVMSPDGDRVVSVSLDNTIRLWDTTDGGALLGDEVENSARRPLSEDTRHPKDPTDVVFFRFGERDTFLTGTFRGRFTIRDAKGGATLRTFVTRIDVSLRSFAFATKQPNSPKRLACGLSNGGIMVWDVDENTNWDTKELYHHAFRLEGKTPAPVTSIAFSACNTRIISGLDDGSAVLWHAEGIEGLIQSLVGNRSSSASQSADEDVQRCLDRSSLRTIRCQRFNSRSARTTEVSDFGAMYHRQNLGRAVEESV
ncbi:hypothetical protein V5O48_009246 [Marasmius crinis-equi]|uniref:T6SS Phospholipase effector Tle1-like catalytic domain-containing protein n=1 Tax=Marasmius crinis-equi TaxID=585013 RepID=A0ABR3FBL8_9AGAR